MVLPRRIAFPERSWHLASSPCGADTTDREELLRLCQASLCEFDRALARRAPGGTWLDTDGLLLYSVGHSSPAIVNGAVRVDPRLPAADVLSRAEAFFGERGHGFSLCVREREDADLERVATTEGYNLEIELPEMVVEGPLEMRLLPEGVDLRRVVDRRGLTDFVAVVEEAFEDEPDFKGIVRATFADPRSLVASDTAGVVAYLAGEPASAAMVHVSHGAALIGWVSTRESARRRGLGDAVTRAATNAGFEMGARFAHLQAAPMGFPVYAKMGYREVSKYRMYSPPRRA